MVSVLLEAIELLRYHLANSRSVILSILVSIHFISFSLVVVIGIVSVVILPILIADARLHRHRHYPQKHVQTETRGIQRCWRTTGLWQYRGFKVRDLGHPRGSFITHSKRQRHNVLGGLHTRVRDLLETVLGPFFKVLLLARAIPCRARSTSRLPVPGVLNPALR